MTTAESMISNISYTNKDFNTIYPALLDLVKKITYRWDPSISNESDPGVILLKLNALIADKCNYNIDKNVLECFPLSVTQDRNARQLYAQLGYFMHWRLAAETTITMRWVGPTGTDAYTMPRFTMVSDSDDSVVYTLVGETALPLDGSYKQFSAMQGIATNYTVNGSELITAENLDSNNRLYFDFNDVAENGIFITNTDSVINYSDWIKVDNLLVQEVSSTNRYYSFGVTQDTNVCYIEFPENAPEIIGGGIKITYLKTDGGYGNVAPFTIDKFYGNIVAENTNVVLNSDNVQIVNYVPGIGGEDPESIDSAYRNYKRTIGTFDTLVTLRDYTNAIINYPNVSNAIVCDRTNDIQSCYDILSITNGINQPVTIVENIDGEPALTPYDIKFYMLYDQSESVQDILNENSYNKTFRLLDDVDMDVLDDNGNSSTHYVENAFDYIRDLKHISQDFSSVSEYTIDDNNRKDYKYKDKLCFIKNYYPVSGTIVPQYRLTTEQKEEVRKNVKSALFEALNAQQVDFGQEIDYDLIYDTIMGADERIKLVRLDDLVYQTYAVYMWVDDDNNPVFKEVRIDKEDIGTLTDAYWVSGGQSTFKDELNRCYQSPHDTYIHDTYIWFTYDTSDKAWKIDDSGLDPTGTELDTITNANITSVLGIKLEGVPENGSRIGVFFMGTDPLNFIQIEKLDIDGTSAFNRTLCSYQLRNQIAAKSVLAGVTPLCVADENMLPQVGQSYIETNGEYLTPTSTITTALAKEFEHESGTTVYEYTVCDNESVSLFAPNLIDTDEYTSYVRYEYSLENDVLPNTSYALASNEYVALYWSADVDSGYNYTVYGNGQIIKSSFLLDSSQSSTEEPPELITLLGNKKKITGVSYNVPGLDEHISSLPVGNVLSTSKVIVAQSMNTLELTSAGSYCSWILSATNDDGRYVLFNEGQDSYQLKSGEYFLYTNKTRTSLVVLGAGTLLSRDISEWNEEWSCATYQYSSIISDGMDALVNTPNALQQIKEGCTLSVVEQQFITLNKDATLLLTSRSELSSGDEPKIDTNNEYPISSDRYQSIQYKGKDDSGFILVPFVDVNSRIWHLSSQLNINMSKDNPQKLTEGQSFILNGDENAEIAPDNSTPIIYVSSSFPVSVEGGENVNVTHIDEDNVLQIPNISAFSLAESSDEVAYTAAGVTTIKLTDSEPSQDLEINFPNGDYLIRLEHGTEGLTNLTLSYGYGQGSSITLTKFGSNMASNLSKPGIYYLKLTITGNNNINQKLTISQSGADECLVAIHECLKYSIYSGIESVDRDALRDEVFRLNKDYLFDFTYQVDKDEIIKDPLSSLSFFEAKHPFNRCTIGQLDTASLKDVYISERTRS